MAELQAEIAQTKLRLEIMQKRLELLTATHREQIRESLSSPDATERKMAESVAAWWGVQP